jgi:hypothetical protein
MYAHAQQQVSYNQIAWIAKVRWCRFGHTRNLSHRTKPPSAPDTCRRRARRPRRRALAAAAPARVDRAEPNGLAWTMSTMDAMLREAQRLIDAGQDATHLLAKLQQVVDADDDEPTQRVASAATSERSVAVSSETAQQQQQRRQVRTALKAKRAELRLMISRVESSLAREDSAPSSRASVRTPASGAPVQSVPSSRASVRTPASGAPVPATNTLELMPPVLDPKELLPAHLVEGFRAEFRAQQEAKRLEAEAAPAAPPAPSPASRPRPQPARSGANPVLPLPSTLAKVGVGLGAEETRAPPPPDEPDYRAMLHGGNRAAVFRAYPGAISCSSDPGQQASPGKRRGVAGARASQSSIGGLLHGADR